MSRTVEKVTIKRTIGKRVAPCPNCGHGEHQVVLWFEWHGGMYIDVSEWGREAKEVIYVHEEDRTDEPRIRTLRRLVAEWVKENGTAEIARQVRENWRY